MFNDFLNLKELEERAAAMGKIYKLLPLCPKCRKQECAEWAEKFVRDIYNHHTGPYGSARMLALVIDKYHAGELIVSNDMIEAAQMLTVNSIVVERSQHDPLYIFMLKTTGGPNNPDLVVVAGPKDDDEFTM